MQECITDEVLNLKYSELDFDKRLKPFSLLNFFQDIASDNAEKFGFGYSAIYPKNLMWVLLKYRIEFNEYPSNIGQLLLRTEPRGYNRFFAFRNFELLSSKKLLAKASSMWSLVDFSSMKLASIEENVESPYMQKFVRGENDLDFAKIPALTEIHYEKEFEVRYNDIDVNMHANNGNYIVWALEPLPYEFKAKHALKIVDMAFKKEIKYGEKLVSAVQVIDNNTTIHSLKHAQTNEELCVLNCVWTNI